MKAMDILKELSWVKDEDILSAKEPVQKQKPSKMLLIAAAVSVTAVLVGCTAAYFLHVKDMQIGEDTVSIPQWGGQVVEQPNEAGGNRKVTFVEGEYQGTQEVTRQVFSMSGLKGSPEFKAAREWFQFRESFDPDREKAMAYYKEQDAIRKKDPNYSDPFGEAYTHYGVYDPVMAEKVDEILEKYDLKRLTDWLSQWYEFEEPVSERIRRFTGVENFFHPESDISIHSMSTSSITAEKRFYMDCNLRLPWEGIPVWNGQSYDPCFTVEFIPKGCFEPDVFRMDTDEKFQEETYTTKSGDQVLILQALEGVNSMLFCQRSDGMIALKIESRMDLYYEDENGVDHADCTYLTMDQLKELADAFDFSLELNPDWEYAEQEHENYRATLRRLDEEQRARDATREPDDQRDG